MNEILLLLMYNTRLLSLIEIKSTYFHPSVVFPVNQLLHSFRPNAPERGPNHQWSDEELLELIEKI